MRSLQDKKKSGNSEKQVRKKFEKLYRDTKRYDKTGMQKETKNHGI
jgi:hypothetical protein